MTVVRQDESALIAQATQRDVVTDDPPVENEFSKTNSSVGVALVGHDFIPARCVTYSVDHAHIRGFILTAAARVIVGRLRAGKRDRKKDDDQ